MNKDAFTRLVNLIEQDREFIVFGGRVHKTRRIKTGEITRSLHLANNHGVQGYPRFQEC